MVGVPTSRRCLRCRKKKVKCDGNSPVCDRCNRAGQECSYPEKFQFVGGSSTTRPIQPAASRWNSGKAPQTVVYTFTSERLTGGGGLFQKWHYSKNFPVLSNPSLSPAEKESSQLVACFEEGPDGARMHWIGKWLTMLPQRIGSSKALDHSIGLVVAIHAAMLYKRGPPYWIETSSYLAAIKSLRTALADPVKCYTTETLSATALLYYLEAIFGSPLDLNFIHHAGGVSHLMEVRGPLDNMEEFEVLIIRQVRGIAIARAVQLGMPCFLVKPLWAGLLQQPTPSLDTEHLTERLLQLMASWPELAIRVRRYLSGQLHDNESDTLRLRLTQISEHLSSIENQLQTLLSTGSLIKEMPSIRADEVLGVVFEFTEYTFALVLMLHASYTLIINGMTSLLAQSEVSTGIDQQSDFLVDRVCRSYEYAWNRRPMGSQYMLVPLTVTFSRTKSESTRKWLLKALNELDEHRMLSKPRFTEHSVTYLAQVYTGESGPLLPQGL